MYDVACAHDLPPIIRERLRLDDPACLAWAERVMLLLAARMAPDKALWWWYRSHIALRRSPAYLLPEDWQPDSDVPRFLERYARQG